MQLLQQHVIANLDQTASSELTANLQAAQQLSNGLGNM